MAAPKIGLNPADPSERIDPTLLFSKHEPTCPTRFAEECAVPIECPHGFDVCPNCDACNCQPKGNDG
jgi:hypothetical protein